MKCIEHWVFYMKQRNKKNFYFTEDTEKAIIEYVKATDPKEKNEIFKTRMNKTFKELIDNIVQVYKFGKLPNISLLKEDCLLYLITVLHKFDKDRDSAAFTYFTVVTKHWFFFQHKKHNKQKIEECNIEDVHTLEEVDNIASFNDYEFLRESYEFRYAFLKELREYANKFTDTDKVLKVLNSIIYIFDHIEEIDWLSKKGIYVYLREISGLETKEISSSIKKLTPFIKNFTRRWNNGEI